MGTQKNRLSEKILFSTHITFIIDEKFLFSAQKLILKRRCVVHPVGSEKPPYRRTMYLYDICVTDGQSPFRYRGSVD